MSLDMALERNIALRSGAHSLDRRQVISSSYGNDSVALIQWVWERGYQDVHVVFVDTGWSGEGWLDRVGDAEAWVQQLGFTPHRIGTRGFESLIMSRKGFPNQRYQWCSGHLKGVPFLDWIHEIDPNCEATVLIGKRREESRERSNIGEWVTASDYHGGRTLRHPLYLHDDTARDALIEKTGFVPLAHRSQECAPCVNANRKDLMLLTPAEITRVEVLEFDTGQNMFRPKRHQGAKGIRQVVEWANSPRGKYGKEKEQEFNTCSSGYCGY
jgi:3'-phosphoadenosine 5'-phosphosulfate sulfotransferase (PAPS reductase)/FAD synthetase